MESLTIRANIIFIISICNVCAVYFTYLFIILYAVFIFLKKVYAILNYIYNKLYLYKLYL